MDNGHPSVVQEFYELYERNNLKLNCVTTYDAIYVYNHNYVARKESLGLARASQFSHTVLFVNFVVLVRNSSDRNRTGLEQSTGDQLCTE